MAESFLATLTAEFYYRRVWPTKARTRLEVGAWIEDRYNRRRRHSYLDNIPPVEYERDHYAQKISSSTGDAANTKNGWWVPGLLSDSLCQLTIRVFVLICRQRFPASARA